MAQNDILISVGVDSSKFAQSIAGIRQEMRELNKIDMKIISPEQARAVTARIGELKGSMEDIRATQSSLDQGDVFGNMSRFAGVAAQGVAGVTGAMSLLGIESKKTGEVEKQILQFMAIGNALQSVADAKRLKTLAVIYAQNVKDLVLDNTKLVTAKLSFDMTNKQTVAELAGNKAKTAGALVTQAITKAQWAWNAAMAANPVGLLIVAIAALVAGIYLLTKAFGSNTDEAEKNKKMMEDQVKVLEDYNQKAGVDAVNATNDLLVAQGKMTESERELINIRNESKKAVEDETKVAVTQAAKIIELSKKRQDAIREEGAKRLIIVNGVAVNAAQVEADISKNLEIEVANRTAALNKLWGEYRKGYTDIKTTEDAKTQIVSEADKKRAQEAAKARAEKFKSDMAANAEYNKKLESDSKKAQLSLNSGDTDKWLEKRKKAIEEVTEEFNANLISFKEYEDKIIFFTEQVNKSLTEQAYNKTQIEKNAEQESLDALKEAYDKQIDLLKSHGKDITETTSKYQNRREDIMKETGNKIKGIEEQLTIDINTQNEKKAEGIKNGEALVDQRIITANENRLDLYRTFWSSQLDLYDVFVQQMKDAQETGNAELIAATYVDLEARQVEIRKGMDDEIAEIKKQTALKIQQKQEEVDRLNAIKAVKQSEGVDTSFLDTQINDLITQMQTLGIVAEKEIADIQVTWNNFLKGLKPIKQNTLIEQFKIDWDKIFDEDDLGAKIQKISELASMAGQYVIEALSASIAQQQELLNQETEKSLQKNQEMLDENMRNLDNALEWGIISQEKYNLEKIRIEKEADDKAKELKRTQAEQEKKWNISKAIMSVAQSVLSALAQAPPMSYVLAALNAALGAYQISLIRSTPVPSFALGGPVMGPSHTLGGVPIEVEGGEYMIKKSVAQKPGMGSFLNKVNQGQISPTTINNSNGVDIETMRGLIKEITSIPVINVESDTTRVQRRVENIESKSKW